MVWAAKKTVSATKEQQVAVTRSLDSVTVMLAGKVGTVRITPIAVRLSEHQVEPFLFCGKCGCKCKCKCTVRRCIH